MYVSSHVVVVVDADRAAVFSTNSTPGVRVIISFLIKVSLPAHLLYRAVEHCFPSIDRHLGWGCYTVLASLFLFFAHVLYTHAQTIYHLHRAQQLNALPIPSTSGSWPGNLDLLKKWIGIWKTGYPGDIAGRLMTQLGGVETYAVKMCWKDTVFTADPEVVKEMLTTDHANYIKGEFRSIQIDDYTNLLLYRSFPHRRPSIRARLRRVQYQW